ncbi:MAG: O-acetylhomoserine aminocarboxypropyltransferase/cysteine synthase [Clostridia bacterium]|nr:O-acetylhomoserine aminocarboxypropyltransferase/cysteine synthase [Clostridia bacterium]
MNNKYRIETLAIHAGQEEPDKAFGARAVPIYMTTSYVFEDCGQAAARFALEEEGNIYTRLTNPTTSAFEARVAALEGGADAIALASGAAAITAAIQNIVKAGQHIVSAPNLYGGTYNLFASTLPEQGITTTFVDQTDPQSFARAIRPETRLIYAEVLGNPNSDLVDLEAIAKIAHDNGIVFMVDSTFATPILIRPIEHGADIVVHSATKFMGGHGVAMGGVVVDSGKFDWKNSGKYPQITEPNDSYHGVVFGDAPVKSAYVTKLRCTILRDEGAVLSPMNAFMLLQGLETLPLRVERHTENALKVVEYLKKNPKVEKVNHPSLATGRQAELYKKYLPHGGGAIFTIDLKGGKEKAVKFTESLKLFSLLANVADVKSLVIHPASTTHAQLDEEGLKACGISPSTVRLSVGCENIEDILEDLEQAFAKI